MKLIKAMESSGGKDTAHRTLASGIHEGDTAVGKYGLMPNTAKEIANRRKESAVDDVIANIPNKSVEALLQENPDIAKDYVQYMAEKVLDKTKGDPVAGMTAWHYGHNMSPNRIKKTMQENPSYVDKVNQRIDENALSSKMPSLMELLEQKPEFLPMSKKRK